MALQWRAAAKDENGRLFIVPQHTKICFASAEYALEKDKIDPKTFSCPSPYMHMGGFPTLQY